MESRPPGDEGAEALPSAEAAASVHSVRPADDHCKLSVGVRWRGFHVEALAKGGSSHVFHATNIGLMEEVLISASPVTPATEWRKGTKLKWLRAVNLPYNFAPLLPLKERLLPRHYATKAFAYRKTIRPSHVAEARQRLAAALATSGSS